MTGAAALNGEAAVGQTGAAPALQRAVTTLRLQNFRNYAALDLAVAAQPVVLCGANGAGKTNVLEAISCLAPGRGLRRAATADIARRAPGADDVAGPWVVSADLMLAGETQRLGVGQDPAAPSRRIIRLNGEAVAHAALGSVARVAWLTPAQDRVFTGPRSERLRFYDRLTLALEPGHGAAATAYERALRERTRLLAEGGADPAWVAGLEAQMAVHGARIATARADLLARLQRAVDARPDTAFPKADLALAGDLEAQAAAGAAMATLEAGFLERLARERRRDAAAGRALDGPHRTDFQARHRAKAMPAAECSTGEQKALLVGLVIAHARALDDVGGVAGARGGPILLLDEAVAHLDPARRAALAEEVCALDGQTWLTGTDEALFDAFVDRAQIWSVQDGRVASA